MLGIEPDTMLYLPTERVKLTVQDSSCASRACKQQSKAAFWAVKKMRGYVRGDPASGHMDADLVSHSGPVAKGSWAWTLTLTNIATGWT